jgi:hypothetical protein
MAYVTFLVQVTCVTSDMLVQLSGLEAKNIVDLRLDLGVWTEEHLRELPGAC